MSKQDRSFRSPASPLYEIIAHDIAPVLLNVGVAVMARELENPALEQRAMRFARLNSEILADTVEKIADYLETHPEERADFKNIKYGMLLGLDMGE